MSSCVSECDQLIELAMLHYLSNEPNQVIKLTMLICVHTLNKFVELVEILLSLNELTMLLLSSSAFHQISLIEELP